MDPRDTVRRFVDGVNRLDNEACYDLMADNFRFTDSMGAVFSRLVGGCGGRPNQRVAGLR